jgi:prepilin-type N-terminal cleavage/methylation domain-containing protein/prepilin-type processing-associated H-X9-DG protein
MSPLTLSRSARPRRSGYNLVELLVVIGIISLLMGLIIPAVNASRESANRLRCQNNLKNMGIAIHLYHDAKNKFPSAGAFGAELFPLRENWGIFYQITAYLDGNEVVLRRIKSNDAVQQATVALYFCPSVAGPRSIMNKGSTGPPSYGGNDYRGIHGSKPLDDRQFDGIIVPQAFFLPAPQKGKSPKPPSGPFANAVARDMVRDGLGTTAMLCEARLITSHAEEGTPDEGSTFGWTAGAGNDTLRTLTDGWGENLNRPGPRLTGALHQGAGSSHPSGINLLFADGVVSHTSFETDELIRSAWCTRNGGETIDANGRVQGPD